MRPRPKFKEGQEVKHANGVTGVVAEVHVRYWYKVDWRTGSAPQTTVAEESQLERVGDGKRKS